MSKEYVLITGATGFIGSHVVEKLLLDNRYHVVAIVRKIRNYKNVLTLKDKGAILIEGNFYKNTLLDYVFENFSIKYVIHIAALRGLGAGTEEDYYRINVIGTEMLLERSLKNHVEKFIFCSSVGVYGTIPSELPATLTTSFYGDNDYHRSKILAERKVQEFIDMGLIAFVVRPTITYGSRDNGFASMLVKLVRRRMLLLPFHRNKIHLLDVDKLAEVFLRILAIDKISQRIFIVADEVAVSCQEIVDTIYSFYYQTTYPPFLKLPNFAFDFLAKFFDLMRSEKWLLRVLLISKSWYYDISSTRMA